MMTDSKLLSIAPSFFLFIFLNFSLYSCFDHNAIILCPEIENQALLGLKQSLSDPLDSILSSWNPDKNCCSWKGVVCSNLTGHVNQLRLRGYYLTGKLNSSLLNLIYLRYIDLSLNNFMGETIPSFIGSFTNLKYLNLSNSNFVGTIPQIIGNLSNLNSLSLEGLYESNVDNIEWLSGLYQLVHLNMNSVDLSRATNWLQVINKISSLKELHLHNCHLDVLASLDIANMSSLSTLDLSSNQFDSFIPRWIFQLSNLIHLDPGFNNFQGAIPNASHSIKLQHLDISHNMLKSTIPDWFCLCKDLAFVNFYYNSLHGTISSDVGNLSSLSYLYLDHNDLTGTIPREIGNLNKMLVLSLFHNKLSGEIPYSFGNMSNLEDMNLGCNQLTAALPASFKFLSNLKAMNLSNNQLGALPTSFGNMSKLEKMDLSGNKLVAALPILFGTMSNLEVMDLGHNQLGGAFPISFGYLPNLEVLDLTYNHLSALPASLAILSSLKYLHLSSNNLSGNFSASLGHLFNLISLYIDDNKLRGIVTENNLANFTRLKHFVASGNHLTLKVKENWIPPFQLEKLVLPSWNLGPNAEIPSWLETQKNLSYLDLSNTGISGTLPHWIWNIAELNLSHNNLHGKIPHGIGNGLGKSLVLSSNRLSGTLPRVSNALVFLDLSNNSFTGDMSHFLCGTGNTTYEMFLLLLNDNQLTGELPDCWMSWSSITYLNLGNNYFSGHIPNSLGIAAMWSLNLYGNKFSGQIPRSLLNCTDLLHIDLSNNALDGNIPSWMGIGLSKLVILIVQSNKLSGEIPLELCHLQHLQILDLSNNKFSGAVPGCFDNYTTMVKKVGCYESLSFTAMFLGSPKLIVLITTKGKRLQYDTFLALVTHINLADNNLSGEIPKQLTRLVELRSLNLSGNHLTGIIPGDIGNMNVLESLDLSSNSLVGEIPSSFTMMPSLSYLNLSYNNLAGKIPESTQLRGMDPASFVGNNLCGPPLPHNCGDDQNQFPKSSDNHDQEDEKSEVEWLYVFISLGYTMGLSAACSILVLKKSWRVALFAFVEHMWDETYVYFYIKWKRLLRQLYQCSSVYVV